MTYKTINIFQMTNNWRLDTPNRYLSCFIREYSPKEMQYDLSNKYSEFLNIKKLLEIKNKFNSDKDFILNCLDKKVVLKTSAEEICNLLKIRFRVTRPQYDEVYLIFDKKVKQNCFYKNGLKKSFITYKEFLDEKNNDLKYDIQETNFFAYLAEVLAWSFGDYEMCECVKSKGVFYHHISEESLNSYLSLYPKRQGKFISLKNEDGKEREYFVFTN